MMLFKHLKQGTSLIEVMAAIAILAIFGSSIFLMQQYLFERMIVAQTKLTAHLRMQAELVDYQKNIIKEQFEHEGVVEKSLQPVTKTLISPDMTIKISTESNIASKPEGMPDNQDGKDWAFTIFKDVHLITATAEQDTKDLGRFYLFVYAPKVEKA
jgi:prepilin-type N-terminal cleavage/methylation domain-containing protein